MSYVYAITDDFPYMENGRIAGVESVKIGFTSDQNIKNRIGQLQTGNPRELHLLYIFEFKDNEMARQMERLAHWNLKSQAILGEWFSYGPDVYNFFKLLESVSNCKREDYPDLSAPRPMEVLNG